MVGETGEAKKDNNPLDDVVEIKENGESVGQSLMFVAVVRHLMRPFLVVFFSILYGMMLCFGGYLALRGEVEWKDLLIAAETIILPLIGYHFGKPSSVDKK